MRPVVESRFGSPRHLPWHDGTERPSVNMDIEVDLGDSRIWYGVRYEAGRFVDVENSRPVDIRRWRYARNAAAA